MESRRLSKLYLIMYMLYSEYMVAEQQELYSRAQGQTGPRHWALVDFVRRLATKGVLRTYEVFFARYIDRFFAQAYYLDARVRCDGKVAARLEFACTLAEVTT